MKTLTLSAVLALLAAPVAAQAQAPAETPAETEEAPLCTDRPTKSNSACTVPAGAIQIESDIVSWTRTDAGDLRSDVIAYTNPTVKYGLGANTDIQFNIAPYITARTRVGGDVDKISGVGDLLVRLKQRLTNPDDSLQIGLIPFVKAPTAKRGIGNREWEGGLAVPIQYSLPGGTTLTFGPELDVLHDGEGSGKHVQLIGTVNIGKGLAENLTGYVEFWTAQNYDPAGTVRQYSADIALAYLARPTLQFDIGANFGLNRSTPDAQLYFGVSTRF